MNKIGLFYSYNAKKSVNAAEEIAKQFGDDIETINAEEVNSETFLKYDNLILSCPTWFDGELPNYWDEFLPDLEELDLKGKKIAIFGLGDQKGYPENFVDAVGMMAEICTNLDAEITGYTSAEGYSFESSKAFKDGQFCGLVLDYVSQKDLNNERISNWCSQLKKTFK